MSITAGIDVGSTYTKAILINQERQILGREIMPTGFKLSEVAMQVFECCLSQAGLTRDDVDFRAHCPHGRPVLLRISVAEIARRFGR